MAQINITINVPDAFIPRVQAAFNGASTKSMFIDYVKRKVIAYETKVSASMSVDGVNNDVSSQDIT